MHKEYMQLGQSEHSDQYAPHAINAFVQESPLARCLCRTAYACMRTGTRALSIVSEVLANLATADGSTYQ